MDDQRDPVIRETAEAMLRELEFYRELKKRRTALSLWKPKAELTTQQEMALRQSTCDPILQQVAKTVLQEIQYNRNERKRGMYFVYFLFFFIFIVMMVLAGLIIWEHNKPPRKSYLSKYKQ